MTLDDWLDHHAPHIAAWREECLAPNFKILPSNPKNPYELFRFHHYEDGLGIVYMKGNGTIVYTGCAAKYLKGKP